MLCISDLQLSQQINEKKPLSEGVVKAVLCWPKTVGNYLKREKVAWNVAN